MPPHPLIERFSAAWPDAHWRDVPVLLAVSGGADSVALLRLMAARAEPTGAVLHVAHFNHGLRGEQSQADQRFVVQLAEELGFDCHVGQPETPLLELPAGDGIEAAARVARYAFLLATAQRLGARYLVTAHTADDQAETIFHHVVRGTGLAGLAGMPRVRVMSPAVTLLRPLLAFRRADLVEFLQAVGQSWREDSSNQDQGYLRNRIRHELIPLLVDRYHPAAVEALLRLGRLAADAQAALEPLVERLLQKACPSPAEQAAVRLDCRPLAGEPVHLVREALVHVWRLRGWPLGDMTLDHWQALAELALPTVRAGAITLPGGIQARRAGDSLQLAGPAARPLSEASPEQP